MGDGGRTILITGCSSGLGRDAARTLQARGWRVFATCRREEDCEILRSEGIESFRLDYSDPESVAEGAAEALERTGGRLDALYNNGAYVMPGAVEDLPRGALAENFDVNLFGVHDLTRRIIPAMRARGGGRIVNCSSVLGIVPARYRGSYVATKYALEGLTDALRMEMRGTGIHVVLLEPGPIDTPIRAKSRPHFEKWIDWRASPRRAEYEALFLPRLYAEPVGRRGTFELGPEANTAKLIRALEARRPRARYRVTTATWLAETMRRALPSALRDRILMSS
jgi:NAD(P)-dependent dehydrogenase (short-subunit alcohol dehydrogenase family)